LPRICKLNNKYREIYTRKSSVFRLHAARARRGLVAPVARGRRSIRRLALLRAAPRWTYFIHAHAHAIWMHVHDGTRGEGVRLYTLHCALFLSLFLSLSLSLTLSFYLIACFSFSLFLSLSPAGAERSGIRLERVRLPWFASASLSLLFDLFSLVSFSFLRLL